MTTEHPNLSYNGPSQNNNVMGNMNSFNDVNSKMNIIRELYSLGVYQTTLQGSIIYCRKKGLNTIVTTGDRNDRSTIFILSLLHTFTPELNACQALIIVPNEELAVYVKQVIESVNKFLGLDIYMAGNGNNNFFDVPQFEVGLPDELHYKITQRKIVRDFIKTVIVISPDKMERNVELICQGIIRGLPRDKHVTLILSDPIDTGLMERYNENLGLRMAVCVPNPNEVHSIFLKLPKQFYIPIENDMKIELFSEINSWFGYGRVVVFCNSLSKAHELCALLYDLRPTLFHLEMDANHRHQILESFTSNQVGMIFTIDSIKVNEFQLADCVVYYDFPKNPICYLNTITEFKPRVNVFNFIQKHELKTKGIIETICKSSMMLWPVKVTKYFTSVHI